MRTSMKTTLQGSCPFFVALFAIAAIPFATFADVPEVSAVTMSQDTTRLVTITYTLADAPAVVTLDVQTNANTSAGANDPGWTSIGGKAVWNADGDVWKRVEIGSRTITWHPDQSWPDHKIAAGGARAVVTAWALDNTPDYMAVDISSSGGANKQTYYPSAEFVPGGVSNSLYKQSTVLMRKIMAKNVKWSMGTPGNTAREILHQVTLTNNYYIGVYEVTQAQWKEVTGYNRSAFTAEYQMRPAENVCYNEIRNAAGDTTTANTAYDWPAAPNSSSFLGKLRTRTGIDFDLPSDAQWEFAARAGNGDGYWGDGSAATDANLKRLARYSGNPTSNSSSSGATTAPATGGTAIVGSYFPNKWGLYDMHGNVWEWCLDWHQANISEYDGKVNIDPTNSQAYLDGTAVPTTVSEKKRVRRGGSWAHGSGECRSANRDSPAANSRSNNIGFRLYCTAGLR